MAQWIARNESAASVANGRVPALTYILDEAHGRAVRLLRSALRKHGLQVVTEMDLSDTIRHELGVQLAQCHVMCIVCPYVLLQAVVTDTATATLVPLHVVVAEDGQRTRIHVSTFPCGDGKMASPVGEKVFDLVNRIVQCFEAAGAYPA